MTTTYQVPSPLPITTGILYLEPDGTYQLTPSGAPGETQVTVNVTDGVCLDDLDPSGSETTSDLQGLAQDVYHLLLQVLGSNLDAPTLGIGVKNLLSASSLKLAAAASIVDSQLRKDTRIQGSQTTVVQNSDGPYAINIVIVASGTVLPLSYQYSKQTGLVVTPP
jgi:hypothetical protein